MLRRFLLRTGAGAGAGANRERGRFFFVGKKEREKLQTLFDTFLGHFSM